MGAGVTGRLGRSIAVGKSVRIRLSRRSFRLIEGENTSSEPVTWWRTRGSPRRACESMIARTYVSIPGTLSHAFTLLCWKACHCSSAVLGEEARSGLPSAGAAVSGFAPPSSSK